MQTDELPICSICSQPTEQILLLRCSHNPCIACSINLTSRGSSAECECPICGMVTQLEPSTIFELKRYKKQVSHSKSHSALDCRSSLKKVVKLTNTEANKSTHLSENEQKDEAFCFGCWKLISLEHMMLDSHRNHQVKMISKGFTKLRVLLEDKEDALQRKQDQIARTIIDTEHQRMECEEALNFKKRQIIEAYSKVKSVIEHSQEKAILNLFDSHRGYLKNIDEQLRKLKTRTCQADLLKNQILQVISKIQKTDRTAFEDIPKLTLEIQSQLNVTSEIKTIHKPNMSDFEINIQGFNYLSKKLNHLEVFGKPSTIYKTLESCCNKSEHKQSNQIRDNNFFDELKAKFFNNKNNTSVDEIKHRIFLKTPSSEKYLQTSNRSVLTDRRKNINLTEEPLQITKNKLKRQLGQSVNPATQRNKQNFKIML